MSRIGKCIKKIPGGKLLRLDVMFDDTIQQIKITGDFFLYPEEVLPEIEDVIRGAAIPLNQPELINRVNAILQNRKATLVGFAAEDLIQVLEEAVQ